MLRHYNQPKEFLAVFSLGIIIPSEFISIGFMFSDQTPFKFQYYNTNFYNDMVKVMCNIILDLW